MFVAIAARRDSASFRKACRERRLASGGQAGMPEPGPVRLRTNVQPDLPPISLDHLAAMSDDTGIFQHAVHAIADRSHGYCIDDKARELRTEERRVGTECVGKCRSRGSSDN